MAMDLRQLRHFVAVAQHGSFSRAADSLRLTQAALSKSIRTLELSLGVRLLDRGPTGVSVTNYGEHLLGYGKTLLALSDEAVEELEWLKGGRRGTLNIGSLAGALRRVVPSAVLRFSASRPDVRIVVHDGLGDTLITSLLSGALDLAITAQAFEGSSTDFEVRVLTEETITFVCGRHHPLAAQDVVRLEDLVAHRWVIPARSEPDRLKLDALFARSGLSRPEPAFETTSIVFLGAILNQTTHLSYLPMSGTQGLPTPELVPLRIAEPTWSRKTSVVFRRKGVVRPIVLAFVEELARAAASEAA
ncbi:LysR family transcriptional regulator [uncultured Alsobacter sp.]|uniref:LysR family transcriptional regulator n=1 Tax=uncultured Alsobacter sp. TaxID=1748258 RepID=UPI0025E9B292|nr:LysR family transcriptional regulator [uncultured Alsobacter sp.]